MLKWFEDCFPDYVEAMASCTYYFDANRPNKHHLEGDVWSHVQMAYACGIKRGVPKPVLWALILHDIGRVHTRTEDEEEQRVYFYDFEGVSCFVALEMLKQAGVSREEILIILKLIAFQYTVIDHIKYDSPTQSELVEMFLYDEEMLHYLALYVECDLFGRKIDESVQHYYDLQKIREFQYYTKNKKNTTKKLRRKPNTVYLLVGAPCSGKSTWAQQHQGEYLIVNRDSSTEQIGKKYGKHTFDEAYRFLENRKALQKEVNRHYNHIEKFAKQSKGIDIVVDNPNLKQKHRKEWIDIFHKTHNIKVVLFLRSFAEMSQCDKIRRMSHGKSIGDTAILDKLLDFVFPLKSEEIDIIEVIF